MLRTLPALLLAAAIPLLATEASAAPPRDDIRNGRLARFCQPGLLYAAGACVRRCPAGYRRTGRICRYNNMYRD